MLPATSRVRVIIFYVITMRRRRRRIIQQAFPDRYYKPRGVPMSQLREVSISDEELESLRLRFIKKMDQREAAEQMNISQSRNPTGHYICS